MSSVVTTGQTTYNFKYKCDPSKELSSVEGEFSVTLNKDKDAITVKDDCGTTVYAIVGYGPKILEESHYYLQGNEYILFSKLTVMIRSSENYVHTVFTNSPMQVIRR